jgi:hypothetical protein
MHHEYQLAKFHMDDVRSLRQSCDYDNFVELDTKSAAAAGRRRTFADRLKTMTRGTLFQITRRITAS